MIILIFVVDVPGAGPEPVPVMKAGDNIRLATMI